MQARLPSLAILLMSLFVLEANSAQTPKPTQSEKKESPKKVKFAMKDKPSA